MKKLLILSALGVIILAGCASKTVGGGAELTADPISKDAKTTVVDSKTIQVEETIPEQIIPATTTITTYEIDAERSKLFKAQQALFLATQRLQTAQKQVDDAQKVIDEQTAIIKAMEEVLPKVETSNPEEIMNQ